MTAMTPEREALARQVEFDSTTARARTEAPATSKQDHFIRVLLNERVIPDKDGRTGVERKAEALRKLDNGLVSKFQASKIIEWLMELPRARTDARESADPRPTWPDVPAGRYALEDPEDELNPVKFYQVDRPDEGRWAGFTFLNRFASDERFPIKNTTLKRAVLEEIAKDPRAASSRFGHETNHCGVCGRRLTREESRAKGIGPICEGRMGWSM